MTDYSDLQEPVFGQDEFRKPKVLSGWDAVLQTILVVLFGRPGCFPSIPELGMNIQQYRYIHEKYIECDKIKSKLAAQCKLVSKSIDSSEIDVKTARGKNGDLMLIFVIPMEVKQQDNSSIVIGVEMREDGIRYNYELISGV